MKDLKVYAEGRLRRGTHARHMCTLTHQQKNISCNMYAVVKLRFATYVHIAGNVFLMLHECTHMSCMLVFIII